MPGYSFILCSFGHSWLPRWRRVWFCFLSCHQPSRGCYKNWGQAFRFVLSILFSDKDLPLSPGYLFCSEVMPLDHEFRLMLINTLRKVSLSTDALCQPDSISIRTWSLTIFRAYVWLWTISSHPQTKTSSQPLSRVYMIFFRTTSGWTGISIALSPKNVSQSSQIARVSGVERYSHFAPYLATIERY